MNGSNDFARQPPAEIPHRRARLRGHAARQHCKRQWEKFSALPNIRYTDALECHVALVSELLADRFGKHRTFADEGVVSLDSSTGTAA